MFAYWVGGFVTLFISILIYYPALFYVFLFVLYSLILICITIFGTIYIHHTLTTKEKRHQKQLPSNILYNATRSPIFDSSKLLKNSANLPIIFGRTVDSLIQQILDNTLRDFVQPWLGTCVKQPKRIMDIFKQDLWTGIGKLHERALKIDSSKTIACDFVLKTTIHLEKIRIAKSRVAETGEEPVFATSSYLSNSEKELEFLKKISEIAIIFLLPRGYSMCPIKDLLSEILSYKLLYPAIKTLTSPDYLNQKTVSYIETKLVAVAISKRSYEYAASFEEFLKVINTTQTIDELLSIRTSIVNDIMQATTMQNLQRSKGLDRDFPMNSSASDGEMSRSEITASLKLKKYIQQLSFGKSQCEKCLTRLGWEGSVTNDLNLSVLDILSTVIGRRQFVLFLEPLKASSLVGYYTTVEELKHASKSAWHQLGAEIFYAYIRNPNAEIYVDKERRKKMESFLVGDIGPEVFYELQKECLVTLEEKYYQPFLLSEEYSKLKESLSHDDYKDITLHTFVQNNSSDSLDDNASTCSSLCELEHPSIDVGNHSTYARNKLEQLDEKLTNKNHALEALKLTLKPDSKLLGILEKEIDWIRSEKRQLEAHLLRTEVWGEYLGKWRALIESVEVPDDKESPQFMVVVQVEEVNDSNPDDLGSSIEATDSITTGWVLLRTLTQFHELNRKLKPMCNDKQLDLPSNNALKLFFLKNDKSSLEKVKQQVQKYLNFILEDEQLNQSEALYEFLSPSSEHLKQAQPSPSKKSSKFSLSTIFKISNNEKIDTFWGGPNGIFKEGIVNISDVENVSSYLEEAGNSKAKDLDVDTKDSIAEPIYALMGEIFDMGGVFKWIRKSLISFVQITYGHTINRQIRETVSYLFEETMLHYYATNLLKSFWPGGVLNTKYPERSDDEKEMTMNAAKSLMMDNIPELLCNLVGSQTAKHGAIKIFENIQNPIYNKQLFYDLLEIVMLEIFPEIKNLKPPHDSISKN